MVYGKLNPNENVRAPTVFVALLPDVLADRRARY